MKYLPLIFALLLCTSCAQLSHFQSARTVGKQNITVGGAVSAYGLVEDNDNDIINNYIVLPYAVGKLSYGLSDKIDLSGSVSLAGNILVSPKFQFIGNQTSSWAASLEPGIGVQFAPNDGDVLMRYRIVGSLSHYLKNQHSITIEPAHILQVESNDSDDDLYFFTGGTLSYQIPWKERLDLGFGASLFRPYSKRNQDAGVLFNVGVGLQYRFSR